MLESFTASDEIDITDLPEKYWQEAGNTDSGDLLFISCENKTVIDADRYSIVYKFVYKEYIIQCAKKYIVKPMDEAQGSHNTILLDSTAGSETSDIVVDISYETKRRGWLLTSVDSDSDSDEVVWNKLFKKHKESNEHHICGINPSYKSILVSEVI